MKKIIAVLLSMSLCLSGMGIMCRAEEVKVNEVVTESKIRLLIDQINELEKQIDIFDDQIDDLEKLESFNSTDVNNLIKQIETKKITAVEAKNKMDKRLKIIKELNLKQKTSKSTVRKRKKIICKILKYILNVIMCGVGFGVVAVLYRKISKIDFNELKENAQTSMEKFTNTIDDAINDMIDSIRGIKIDFGCKKSLFGKTYCHFKIKNKRKTFDF